MLQSNKFRDKIFQNSPAFSGVYQNMSPEQNNNRNNQITEKPIQILATDYQATTAGTHKQNYSGNSMLSLSGDANEYRNRKEASQDDDCEHVSPKKEVRNFND